MNGDISCEKESILSTMKPSKAILKLTSIKPTLNLFKTVMDIGIPTAVVQICLAASTSLTNMAAYSFGAKNEGHFNESERFALKSTILLTILVSLTYILLSKPLISLFNQNPTVIEYGSKLLISQVAIYPAFGICYLMTIIFQSIGASKYGVFLSTLRQGLLYIPFILILPHFFGILGIYLSQPLADVLTLAVSLFSYPKL